MASSSDIRRWWSAWRCAGSRMVGSMVGDQVVWVNPNVLSALSALERALTVTGYSPVSVGGYYCRPVKTVSGRASSVWSTHAYGLAVDIDPFALGNDFNDRPFSWNYTNFTPTQVAAVEGIRTVSGHRLWQWGGWWPGAHDYMHFQIDVSPRQLASGIEWSTVPSQGDDIMEFIISVLKNQDTAFFANLQALTGSPGGDPSYWGDNRASHDEWVTAAPEMLGAIFQASVDGPHGGGPADHFHQVSFAEVFDTSGPL